MHNRYPVRQTLLASAALATAALSPVAMAADADVAAGDWIIRGGFAQVDPKSDNGTLDNGLQANVDSASRPTVEFAYMFTDNVGLELLASAPFEHDVALAGAGHVGSVEHLPPTLTLQYHFNNSSAVRPYVGVGLNYTTFSNESTADGGALDGADLELDASTGVALQAGVDYAIDRDWFANLNVRWIDIESEVEVDGADVGDVEIDPVVMGVGLGYRF